MLLVPVRATEWNKGYIKRLLISQIYIYTYLYMYIYIQKQISDLHNSSQKKKRLCRISTFKTSSLAHIPNFMSSSTKIRRIVTNDILSLKYRHILAATKRLQKRFIVVFSLLKPSQLDQQLCKLNPLDQFLLNKQYVPSHLHQQVLQLRLKDQEFHM